MLRKANDLLRFGVHALDGDLGHINDFYFDEAGWVVRYVILRTGPWFFGKQVMISPSAIRDLSWFDERAYLDLTQEQVQNSPDLDLEKPVTREQEMELVRYYAWPSYWSPGLRAAPYSPQLDALETQAVEEVRRAAQADDLPHLRGVKEVTGYRLAATDGEIGHVEDFFIDEESWKIHYLLVDTSNWLPGKQVLIAPDWISDISWRESHVAVDLTQEQVKDSPEYEPSRGIDRTYESGLYDYYGYSPYWR